MIFSPYQKRPIRFVELYEHAQWKLKIYSISSKNEFVSREQIENAKNHLSDWLQLNETNSFESYNIGTLMLHEFNDGCFAIINWWVDENMLQHYVYLAKKDQPEAFELFSSNGIVTCVWESAVLWFERNAWVNHILMNYKNPDFEGYFNQQLNQDI